MIRTILVLGLGLSVAGCGKSEQPPVYRYELLQNKDVTNVVWRLDRITGEIAVCSPLNKLGCLTLDELYKRNEAIENKSIKEIKSID